MKIALCSTTIHMPHALKLLRRCGPEVEFFIACDRNTPVDVNLFCDGIPSTYAIHADQQTDWKCSDALTWNCIARRNIAFLEALKSGADAIYSWDTDNIAISTDHFDQIEMILDHPFDGLFGSSRTGWFDAGQLIAPQHRHRGIPYDNVPQHHYDAVTNFKVGVAAGLVIGNPDVDATLRMEHNPEIHSISEIARAGVLIDVNTHTVFNTQNTAVIRELVPAWFMMPGVGRHDDLYASLIVQRVARERGYHVHFGKPLVWQQRHPHDQIVDLRAEIEGMAHIRQLADLLDHIQLVGRDVIADTRKIYETLSHCHFIPEQAVRAALLWLADCEDVL